MAFLLVAASDQKHHKKGEVCAIKDSDVWGSKEGLPNWVQIEIRGFLAADVSNLLDRISDTLQYASQSNGANWRVRIEKDAQRVGLGMPAEISEYLKDNDALEFSVISESETHLEIDVAKSHRNVIQIQDSFDEWQLDKLAIAGDHELVVEAAEIDLIVAAGGRGTLPLGSFRRRLN